MTSTHEDWERARDERNAYANTAARLLNAGRIDEAKDAAGTAAKFDDDMTRITQELEAELKRKYTK